MVDQYLIPDTKRPLVGRVPGTDTSPPVPGTPLEVPDIISGVAYQASVVSGDGVTAVNYGVSDIARVFTKSILVHSFREHEGTDLILFLS